jgi:hypothetical protein
VLDTMTAGYAESGDFASVMKWQAEAIGPLTDGKAKADYGGRLALCQAKKPYRLVTKEE